MTRRSRPRAFSAAVRRARDDVAPQTPLAAAQAAWPEAVGPRIAAEAFPVAERDGVLTVECAAATWAQELDLLQSELLESLNRHLPEARIERLRVVASGRSAR